MMDDYVISDVTRKAAEIFARSGSVTETPPEADYSQHRRILAEGFTSYPAGSHTERLEVSDMGFILIGSERVDIRGICNIVSDGQKNGIAFILRRMMVSHKPGEPLDFERELDGVYEMIRREGVNSVYSAFFTTMTPVIDLPRKADICAVVSRMRHLRWSVR